MVGERKDGPSAQPCAFNTTILGARRARSGGPESPAPKTPGNPIMIIIPGESIAALDRIGPVRPVPGSRYPGYNADTRRRAAAVRAPFRSFRGATHVCSYDEGGW